MSEVNSKFQEIAKHLSQSNYVQVINLKMPGVANGTKVRFTFDNVSSANRSKKYIEGIFNLSNKSLESVEYVGLTSTSGSTVKGNVEDIFVNFTFEGVRTDDDKLINSQYTDEWTYIYSNSSWQINSEFDKSENSEIRTQRSSAVIMLVLDCSSSLGSQFSTAQSNAKSFINTLYKAVISSPDSEDSNPNPTINGHEYVYLGLPSGLRWATCNVGASSPTGYGDYYAWGEIKPKPTYTADNNVTYRNGDIGDFSGNSTYDAARANWGGSWRMPTKLEFQELVDNCKWIWTTENDIKGYKVTGPNGQFIFLPAAGYVIGPSLFNENSDGSYWSSAPEDLQNAYGLSFGSSGTHRVSWFNRYYGRSIRPVSD